MTEAVHMFLVLIAEDNPGDVFLVHQALETHGIQYQARIASDGQQALRLVESLENDPAAECPDIVLLDLNLPKHSGEEVLARIRATSRCGSTPVVIITSSNSPQDRARVAELGATAYFRKPPDLDQFLELGLLVKQVLG